MCTLLFKKIESKPIIAENINKYLKSFFSAKETNHLFTIIMKYGLFSGGKRFRSAILNNTGRIFKIDYKTLIIIGAAVLSVYIHIL